MGSLAVLILTKNEERNIAQTIRSVQGIADEIILADSGSTDRTVEIAKELGARVEFRAWDGDFAAQRNFSLAQARSDWVLFLDADERPTPELAKAIRKAADSGSAKKCRLERRTAAFGTVFKHGALKPDHVCRLFPRESVTWTGKVHERPVCSLPEEQLPGWLEHSTYAGWKDWERKLCLYSTIWAEDAYARGKRTSLAGVFAHGAGGFFKMFVLRLGFLDGAMGCCLCTLHSFYEMLKYLKLRELQEKNGQ